VVLDLLHVRLYAHNSCWELIEQDISMLNVLFGIKPTASKH